MKTVYLASPLGFSAENRPYLEKVKEKIRSTGPYIIDPWDLIITEELQRVHSMTVLADRLAGFRDLARYIGHHNERNIVQADCLMGIIDGMEPDSGTVAEMGFAAGLGKKVCALRTDLRDCGDFPGIPVNLQVLRFIERNGGKLFRSIEEIQFP